MLMKSDSEGDALHAVVDEMVSRLITRLAHKA